MFVRPLQDPRSSKGQTETYCSEQVTGGSADRAEEGDRGSSIRCGTAESNLRISVGAVNAYTCRWRIICFCEENRSLPFSF